MVLNKIWNYLLDSVKVPPDYKHLDTSTGNLSIEEVQKIALRILEEQEWRPLEPRKFELVRKIETDR